MTPYGRWNHMTIFGMPESMFLVFIATILAGSLGAIHYVFVHVVLGKPVNDVSDNHVEEENDSVKDRATDRGSTDGGR